MMDDAKTSVRARNHFGKATAIEQMWACVLVSEGNQKQLCNRMKNNKIQMNYTNEAFYTRS